MRDNLASSPNMALFLVDTAKGNLRSGFETSGEHGINLIPGLPANKYYQFRFKPHVATKATIPVSELGFEPPKCLDVLSSQDCGAVNGLVAQYNRIAALEAESAELRKQVDSFKAAQVRDKHHTQTYLTRS